MVKLVHLPNMQRQAFRETVRMSCQTVVVWLGSATTTAWLSLGAKPTR